MLTDLARPAILRSSLLIAKLTSLILLTNYSINTELIRFGFKVGEEASCLKINLHLNFRLFRVMRLRQYVTLTLIKSAYKSVIKREIFHEIWLLVNVVFKNFNFNC